MKRRGFTAPELTMVALIIMLLTLAILYANKRSAQQARDTNCMSNVKQLAAALLMYATENDYRLPLQPKAWGAVMPYMRNEQLLRCPVAARTGRAEKQKPAPSGPPGPPGRPWADSDYEQPVESDYLLNPFAQADESPAVIIAGDDSADRHSGRRWVGVRLDGATALWPADEWQTKLGWVRQYAETKED